MLIVLGIKMKKQITLYNHHIVCYQRFCCSDLLCHFNLANIKLENYCSSFSPYLSMITQGKFNFSGEDRSHLFFAFLSQPQFSCCLKKKCFNLFAFYTRDSDPKTGTMLILFIVLSPTPNRMWKGNEYSNIIFPTISEKQLEGECKYKNRIWVSGNRPHVYK